MPSSPPLLSRWPVGTLIALAIGAVAALPLVPPRLPAGADAVSHLYTLIQVDDLLRHGELSLRWLPFGNAGYGNPRFVFYPAAPFYLAGALTLAGLGPVAALRLLFAAALVFAALGAHRWLLEGLDRERPGASTAPLVGCAIYALSPYLLFATYRRASFAELVALALLPWAARAFDRLSEARGGGAVPAAWFAALLLAHPLTAATFGLYVLPRIGLGRVGSGDRPGARRRALGRAAAALACGALLAAASWLPAALERDAIQDTHETARGLRVERNTLSLSTTLAAPPARVPAPALALGALLLGVLGWFARDATTGSPSPTAATQGLAVALVALLLTSPLSAPFWEITRVWTGVFQFPHRLLGVGSLGAALAGAAGIAPWLARVRSRSWRGLVALAAAVAASAAPALLTVRHLAPTPTLDVARVVELERLAGRFATGEKGDFVPRAVRRFPPVAGRPFDPSICWERGAESSRVEVLSSRCGRTRFALDVSALEAGEITLRAFYFPGWRATVDGVPVPLATDAMGRIVLALPEGASRLELEFGATPDRAAAFTLSLLGALGLAIAVRRRPSAEPVS